MATPTGNTSCPASTSKAASNRSVVGSAADTCDDEGRSVYFAPPIALSARIRSGRLSSLMNPPASFWL